MKHFLGLRTAAYSVGNIAEAKKWYAAVFDTPPYFDEPFYVGFNIQGYELGLWPRDEALTNAENLIMYWGVEDIDKSYHMLLEHGGLAHEAPNDVGDGIMVASVRDPWGNVLGIIFNPHFKLPGN